MNSNYFTLIIEIFIKIGYNKDGDILVNYPNGIKKTIVSLKHSAANRGANLENDLNSSNDYYLNYDIAIVHKKPTPIQVVKIDYTKRSSVKITEAYFKAPSTTDYNGIYMNKYIDFEAKETNLKTALPFSNIHPHQISHLKKVINHGAIAFFIIRFNYYNQTYLVMAKKVIELYENNIKSIKYSWLQINGIIIPYTVNIPIDYLKCLDLDF